MLERTLFLRYDNFDWEVKSYLQPKAFLADWTAYDSSGDDERDSEYVVRNAYGRKNFPPRHPDAQRGWDEVTGEFSLPFAGALNQKKLECSAENV